VIFLSVAAVAAAAAVLVATFRERRPVKPAGSWEPVDHDPAGS